MFYPQDKLVFLDDVRGIAERFQHRRANLLQHGPDVTGRNLVHRTDVASLQVHLDPVRNEAQTRDDEHLDHFRAQLRESLEGAVQRRKGSFIVLQGGAEESRYARLQIVSGSVEVFANLGHQPGGKVAQRPVVVQFGAHAQLPRNDAGRDGWDQFVKLERKKNNNH